MDSFPAAGQRDRDGQGWPGYTWGKGGPDHQRPAVLEPGLPNGQKQPHSMVRARNTEGTRTPVAGGRPQVQGALVSRCECGPVIVGRTEPQELPPSPYTEGQTPLFSTGGKRSFDGSCWRWLGSSG